VRSRPPAPAGGIVRLLLVTCLAASPRTTSSAADVLPPYPTEKRFAAAALETLALDVVPWVLNRYPADAFFARISTESIKHNLQTGFTYDHGPFATNQSSHPYHGGAYFNAARTNGYSFWESAPFVLGGSFLWEMFSESQPPSMADLVQTTLGGMAWGEAQFRISNLILDNTKSGFERFLREAAGLVVNPMGGLNRILRGEVAKDFQNPPDRFPGRLYTELDGGYIHTGGRAAEGTEQDQGELSLLLRYGDPFDGDLRHPFDAFEFQIGLRQPAPVLLTQIDIDGLLAAWRLSGNPSAEQRFAFFLAANYFNNDPRNFGARHLLRAPPPARAARMGGRPPDGGFGDGNCSRRPRGRLSQRGYVEPDRPEIRLWAGTRGAGERAGEAPTSAPVDVDSWELDGLFGFGGRTVRGYVGLGAGVQNILPSIPSLDASGVTFRF
jgi:hypothetical protein